MAKQVERGKAFEYALAKVSSEYIDCKLVADSSLEYARYCFNIQTDSLKSNIIQACQKAVMFIFAKERIDKSSSYSVLIQPDRRGMYGDVRDIIVQSDDNSFILGISAKHKHHAVKHPRLSSKIDFGKKWFNIANTQSYWNEIKPIFAPLYNMRDRRLLWKNIDNKADRFYIPLLNAFNSELHRLLNSHGDCIPHRMLSFLLGVYDFYKVIKDNGNVLIESFNFSGNLKWGKKTPLPNRIIGTSIKPDSNNTLIVYFDKGWTISFRIHSASSHVEPSLKFDIKLVGVPTEVSSTTIDF